MSKNSPLPSIQPQRTQDVLFEVRALFERQKHDNVIEVFLRQPLRSHPEALAFGSYLTNAPIVFYPLKVQRTFSGTELAAAIASFYSKDYWLLALWSQLCANADGSNIAREIVRAFVKTCILTTADELVGYGRKGINAKFVVENGLVDRISYYQTIFDWSRIYRNIRLPQRRAIRERFNKGGEGASGFRQEPETARLSSLRDRLPEINQIFKGSGLPEIIDDAHAQSANLRGILRSVYLQTLFWRDSTHLRKELKRLLEVAQ